jgi:hypothetical protein
LADAAGKHIRGIKKFLRVAHTEKCDRQIQAEPVENNEKFLFCVTSESLVVEIVSSQSKRQQKTISETVNQLIENFSLSLKEK